ncbi:MAG: VCBS repeat-containing protein [Nitrospiraceae bacterium]|nr:MAG: VCBS repeat-containing protein [Nitrospiraceae bacterium]
MDWNNDGRHDLLVGDANGNVQLYLNTNSNSVPSLSEGKYIQAGGTILDTGQNAAPDADDWNGDGRKDLVVGNKDGNIKIYLNTGTDASPVLASPYNLQVNGKDFVALSRAAPKIYDWNRDGLKDILTGDLEGYVYYLKNVGSNKSPLFKKSIRLFLGNGDFLRYPDPAIDARSRIFVTDWNNDGLDDILVGGLNGRIMLYLSSPASSHSPLVFVKKLWTPVKADLLKLRNKLEDKFARLTGRT